jgi:HlyD family secretion protein
VAGLAALAVAISGSGAGIKVETAMVSKGAISVSVDEEGRTRLKDLFVVAAPVSGRIDRITLLEGHRVLKGDILARIYPAPTDPRLTSVSRGQLQAAEARQADAAVQVQKARAVGEQAERELQRAQKLSSGGAISEETVERARLSATSAGRDLEASQAAFRAAQADVVSARAALIGANPARTGGAMVEVRAPSAGQVLRVFQQSSRVAPAGTPLVELGDAAVLEAMVDVLSEDAVRIQPGNPVTIDQWGGDNALKGTVRLVEPQAFTRVSALGVEEQRVHVLVELIDPPPALGVGYRLEAHIVIWSAEKALRVPTSALFQREGGWAAFAVRDGRAQRRSVRLGHQSTEMAEVLEGLSEGEQVILYPSALIDDGVRVRVE